MFEQHLNEKNKFLAKAYEVALEHHPSNPLSVDINPRELGKHLGFNQSTVERIMNELVADGHVDSSLGMMNMIITNDGLKYLRYVDNNSFHPLITVQRQPVQPVRTNHPIVFISYSHDDSAHRKWVLELADRMMSDGIDVKLDRYELRLGSNLQHFVETSISKSERIIIIFTPNYKLKTIDRTGGVGYEYSIINVELYNNQTTQEKVIPILRKGDAEDSIPNFMRQFIHLDMSKEENFEVQYEELIREIYHDPPIKKPQLGAKPEFSKPKVKLSENPIKNKGRRTLVGYIDPLIQSKLHPNFACVLYLKTGMIMNAGTIRQEDGYLVHYTGKGLREMWNPNPMTPEQKQRAQELQGKSEDYLEENDYLAWTPLEQIIKVVP